MFGCQALFEFVVLGAWVCLALVVNMGLPFWLAFLFSLVFMMVFGILVQVVLLRPLLGEPVISVIMATIGLSIFMQATMNWIFGNNAVRFPQVFARGTVEIAGLNVETASHVAAGGRSGTRHSSCGE